MTRRARSVRDTLVGVVGLVAAILTGVIVFHHVFLAPDPNLDYGVVDIYSFLYLGSRLVAGELLYVDDFETKLPLIQVVFALPYWLGGIGAWHLVTAVATPVLIGLALRTITASLSGPEGDARRVPTLPVLALSAWIVLLIYTLPGAAQSHIAIAAGACFLLSIAALQAGLAAAAPGRALRRLVAAGAAAAIAASLRPNFLYAVPALFAVPILYRAFRRTDGGAVVPIRELLALTVGFLLVVSAQAAPYLLRPHGIDQLLAGLHALARFSVTQGTLRVVLAIQSQNKLLYASTLLLYLLAFLEAGRRFAPGTHPRALIRSGTIGGVLALALLEVQFLTHHYWYHYVIMIVAFLAHGAAYLLAMPYHAAATVGPRPEGRATAAMRWATVVALVLSVGSAAVVGPVRHAWRIARSAVADGATISLDINAREVDADLLERLRGARQSGLTFYVPAGITYHTMLGERRLGDGHPEMMLYVLTHRFPTSVGRLPLYSDATRNAPCRAILDSGKDLIVVGRRAGPYDRPVLACLEEPGAAAIYRDVTAVCGAGADGSEAPDGRWRFFLRAGAEDRAAPSCRSGRRPAAASAGRR